MKRPCLILLVMAILLAPFIVSAQGLIGKFKMIASGSCIHSENGYSESLQAKPGIVYAGTTTWRGTWNFYRNGTGTYTDRFSATVTPPPTVPPPGKGPPQPVVGGIRLFSEGMGASGPVKFTYTTDADGDIIVTLQDGTIYSGSVSTDETVITLLEESSKVKGPLPAPYWYIICNTARTLIYVGAPDPKN